MRQNVAMTLGFAGIRLHLQSPSQKSKDFCQSPLHKGAFEALPRQCKKQESQKFLIYETDCPFGQSVFFAFISRQW